MGVFDEDIFYGVVDFGGEVSYWVYCMDVV